MGKTYNRRRPARPSFEAVEPRILFSADGLGGIDAGLVDDEKVALEKTQLPTQSETLPTAAQDIERLRRELVLVSEGVDEDEVWIRVLPQLVLVRHHPQVIRQVGNVMSDLRIRK